MSRWYSCSNMVNNNLYDCDKETAEFFKGFAKENGYGYEAKVKRLQYEDCFGNTWNERVYDIVVCCPPQRFDSVKDEYFGTTW